VLMYDVRFERNIMMRLQDGTRLATDVYLPNGTPGPWPAILERTPYNKLGPGNVLTANFFASHGYAVVIQDVRGRFMSEGEFYPFGNEGPDGVEAVAWTRASPRSSSPKAFTTTTPRRCARAARSRSGFSSTRS